jgi:ATP-dependent DNA ligase
VERKRRLLKIVPSASGCLLYVEHVKAQGIALFNEVCQRDLEGVVGKWAQGTYVCDGVRTSWLKIKNPNYSQAIGLGELFEGCGNARPRPKERKLVLG